VAIFFGRLHEFTCNQNRPLRRWPPKGFHPLCNRATSGRDPQSRSSFFVKWDFNSLFSEVSDSICFSNCSRSLRSRRTREDKSLFNAPWISGINASGFSAAPLGMYRSMGLIWKISASKSSFSGRGLAVPLSHLLIWLSLTPNFSAKSTFDRPAPSLNCLSRFANISDKIGNFMTKKELTLRPSLP